ncbi:MAG: circularly permuted type 2 ATP-grasp protein [Bacteriovoracaceae bacterium]|nr:circularly permuted type 2 ATP-grasp protein [Bacteriovoracaceae bacterium]
MSKIKNQRRTSYDPNLGFIGQVKVDVSNYIFSSHRRRSPYNHTKPLVKSLLNRDVSEHHSESQKLTKFIRKRDLTFQKSTKDGSYKIFTVPCTTTVVPLQKSMFNQIERAAQTLIVSLRAVIQDIYGSKSVKDSAFVKSLPKEARAIFIDAVESSPNYFKPLHHPNMKKYPFFDNVGLDLVLVEDYLQESGNFDKLLRTGRTDELPLPFRILELNAGSPSGASNNMNVLEGLYESNPSTLEDLGKLMPNDHFKVLAETYKSLGEDWTGVKDGVQVILPPGGLNGAAPEIHNLAAYSGMVYADPVQLFCDEKGHIRLRTINGSNPIVTAIYSRINADSALFDPEKDLILRDADSGEPIYLRDTLKLGKDGKAPLVLDVDGNPIPLQSDYAIPNLLNAIVERKIYMGGLNRILDNKIILASLTTYAPKFFEKRLRELGLEPAGAKITPPETLPSCKESVEIIAKNPEEWVIKAPNLSGGTGVYILKTLSKEKRAEVIEMAQKEPQSFAYQRLVKIARIPVTTSNGKEGTRFANLAADIRLWMFYGGGAKTLPKLTHNALVRYAPQERGPMSSIVNTSKGGGYAPFVVVDDTNSKESVLAAELVKPKYPAPLMTHLPMFVAAQLIQVSRLAIEIHKQLSSGKADSYELLGLTLSLKLQCREILSFLNPRAIEPVYKLIDTLESKQAKKEIAAYFQLVHGNHIKLVMKLQKLEEAGKLPKGFRDELDRLHILNDDILSQNYTEEHRKADKKALKPLRDMLMKKAGTNKALISQMKAVMVLLVSSVNANFPREYIGGKSALNMAKMVENFLTIVRERLQNSEKAIEFAKLFNLDADHPDLAFETFGLKETAKNAGLLTASQREFATGELLTESEFIPANLQEARKAWLAVLEEAKKIKNTSEREATIKRKRAAHFKKFPVLARFQDLITRPTASISDLIELMPVMPYAHYNLTQLAKKQGLTISALFSDKLTPNKISILSSKQIREHHLSAQDHAGECFAKKRKSHGLFSDSDIFIWVRKELDPLTQIYTAGHEAIHYHQIEETTRMEATALSHGAIAQAYFLNFYGNFLGISSASLEGLSLDIASERQPLYGLADRVVAHFFSGVVSEVRQAINGDSESYQNVLNKYGSLFGYMMPNSTQVRVKALQEILPALENAKNIRFAKELGLDIAWDEMRSALPSANEAQVKAAAPKIERAIKTANVDYEALIAIGNHQFYGVSFGHKIPTKETLRLRPILGVVSLGNSYNQTQQQQ